MSGFIGILAPRLEKADEELLDACTVVIASCCDDYSGAWKSNHIDLRFGWLKTCEDTEADQLPFTIDENLRIVGDVRLDNRTELIKELGLYFNTISNSIPDSYLLLYAYKHWDEDCLQHISGDYAFAIWNEKTNYLFCARDHFGLIPFYYTQLENRFLFTNFYHSLKAVPNLMAELSDEVLRDYLMTGTNRSFGHTIYKEIKKLPPAHKLTCKDGKIEVSCYWEIPTRIKPIRYKTTKEYVSHFYSLFEKSIKDRTRTNKVACSLSGGMDSSSITATAKNVLRDRYGKDHTQVSFNIGYKHLVNENEGYFGKLIAKHLNVPIKQYIAEDYVKNIAEPLTNWIPEPAAVPDATAEAQILLDAAAFSRVLLTGFGGDPLFEYEQRSRERLIAQGHLAQSFLDDMEFYRTFGHFSGINIKQWLMKLIRKTPAAKYPLPYWFEPDFFPADYNPYKPNKDGTSIRSYFAMYGNPFWGWLFETTHPGFTGQKIKIRQPFFSLELLLFMLALPPHLLYQKSLLRMAMIPYLPDEIVKRPKTPLYGSPHSQNLKNKDILDTLEQQLLESEDFFASKIDIPSLLKELRNPDNSSASYKNMLIILQILTWRACKS
ncbi:asparagine synthetase B family protein [Pedobacter cryoconitis]|uniref:asparagine synthase (glutamine-hydrolyzing) n=1 Tax=Pedobacter cryoconitis TaxID=188932 RepID=A0A7X0J1H3_9SPHI|nr:asparagine synthase-related protein [Pedobacter cryoconitis]MBB6499303.1 asparagine synthase (glutamine-hydrolyzing) [Pedobacter cryoconitis]